MKKTLLSLTLLVILSACQQTGEKEPDFTFAFMTDIHVTWEQRADQGFRQAIDSVNALKPDFVITGGDLIMDALGQTRGRADSLFQLYDGLIKEFSMPVYHTVGNHELFAFYNRQIETTDEDYNDGMYRRYLGDPWQSFDFGGWHFIILKSIEDTESRGYEGKVSDEQMDWLREDLARLDDKTPVAVSVHIPLISAHTQWRNGGLSANGRGSVITNGKEVLDLLKTKNLKLVLQGHLHCLEDYYTDGVHFITGGAVSASWWNGPINGLEEGFMMIRVYGDELQWEYVDYGWEAVK